MTEPTEQSESPHPSWLLGDAPQGRPLATRMWRAIFFSQSERERLVTDIDALAAVAVNYRSKAWNKRAFQDVLTRARLHAAHGDVDSGYETLHIAERQSASGMSPEELRAKAVSLAFEIDRKMGTHWRGRASIEMLMDAGLLERDPEKGKPRFPVAGDPSRALPPIDPRDAVADAIWHRNTFDRNSHRKTDQLHAQLIFIGCFLLLQILIIFVVSAKHPIDLSKTASTSDLLPVCIALGLLGGTLSSAIFVNALDRARSFQELGHAWAFSLARALIGCAASIPVYLVASAHLINVGGKDSEVLGILLPCFLDGFSERWFLHIIPSAPRSGEGK